MLDNAKILEVLCKKATPEVLEKDGMLITEDAATEQFVAMHAMLTDTPSLLLQAALVDGVGECRSQNQPGTSSEYSNWRVPLADGEGHVVHTNEVFNLPRVQSLSAVMRCEKR